ncbi:Uncharacterized protein SCF082_LOCUS4272 [Durusdinium trenchii]|uniref:Uncharacterized protein n=1 Tax=Durusdinium trenchii TaxID=1381693 RepID=A0ABP0HYF1_9DINO
MRFSRSLKSKRSPPEIRRAGRAAHRDSSKLQLLLEQWTQCDGVWAESDFVIECRRKTRHRQYGARVWLTRSELITKYQSVAVADSIIEAKEQDEETRQYLVWEKDGEEEQTDHVCSELFRALTRMGNSIAKAMSLEDKLHTMILGTGATSSSQAPVSLEGHYDDVAAGVSSVKRVMRRVRDQAVDPGQHQWESGGSLHEQTLKLGTKSGKNDVRDFWRSADIPEIEYIRVPVYDKKTARKSKVEVYPIIYPHRILAYLFDHVQVELSTHDITEYWDHSRQTGEAWACKSSASRTHIPLGLHGDGARLWTQYKVEKIVAIFLNMPLFRPKSARHSRFLLFTIGRHKLIKNRTINVVWRRLVWSLNACFTGLNPSQGPGGAPLTGVHLDIAGLPICQAQHRFALTELRGDWEWHRDTWRFTASWQSHEVCFRCPAVTRGDESLVYYNNGPTSGWVNRDFTLDQFIARRLKENQLCPLLRLEGFDPSIIKFCSMHALNLGLLFSCNAGALLLLCEDLTHFGQGTFAEQLDEAYRDFLAFCRSRQIRHSQPPFIPRMVKKKNGDELFTAKAFNGRLISSWLNHTLFVALQRHPNHETLILTSSAMTLGIKLCVQTRSLFNLITVVKKC